VLVWLMIVPMLLKIDLAALGQVQNHWRGIVTTVGVNWLVKPFSMALLGWLFIAHLFRPFLPADQIDGSLFMCPARSATTGTSAQYRHHQLGFLSASSCLAC
jgi:ACR3 family arsenite efflux pump ArsB